MLLGRLARATLFAVIAGCVPGRASTPDRPEVAARSLGLSVFVEGPCPKLKVFDAGPRSFLVYGTYGLDEVAFGDLRLARQAIADLRGGELEPDARLRVGLSLTADGWIVGDVELTGTWPDALGLVLVDVAKARAATGALFEQRRTTHRWSETRWTAAAGPGLTPGMRAPARPGDELCASAGRGFHYSLLAVEQLPSGDTFAAGRCEDAHQRPSGGVRAAISRAGDAGFVAQDAPPSPLFEGIANLGIVLRSRAELYLYAYPPYGGDGPAYLVRHDGHELRPVPTPFQAPVTALAAAADGALWAAVGWRALWRFADGQWEEIRLPPPVFADVPVRLRVLDVQAAAGGVWVHASYPLAIDGERPAARSHVLYTTLRVQTPRSCDRRLPAAVALTATRPRLHGAMELTN